MIVNCDKGLLMLKLITVRKRSCGKVMFSHLSDSHSAHGGRAWQERRPLQRTVRILLECFLVREQFASCEVDFNNMEIVYNDNSQIL